MSWIQYVFKFAATAAEANIAAGQQEAEHQAHKQNAENLNSQAQQVGAVAARNEEQSRREYRQFAGEQFASMAESGLGVGGSALDVARDSESQALLDSLNIRYEGQSQARSLRYSAKQETYLSRIASMMARKVKVATHLQGISEALGGTSFGGNAASKAWKGGSAGESASNWNGGSVGGGGFGATYGA